MSRNEYRVKNTPSSDTEGTNQSIITFHTISCTPQTVRK